MYPRNQKRVGFLLGLSIILVPIIFAWMALVISFTLSDLDSSFIELMSVLAVLLIISTTLSTSLTAMLQQSWSLGRYIDDFGDATNEKYISYKVKGTFSNSATTNAKLTAKLLVESSTKISIALYEYGSSRVTECSNTPYTLKIRTKTGDETLSGDNWSDRIVLTEQSAGKLHHHLMNNRLVRFVIRKNSRFDSLTSYSFALPNNRSYSSTFKKLLKSVIIYKERYDRLQPR